jgi:hypothetical protein
MVRGRTVGVPEWASAEWDGAEGDAGRRSVRPTDTADVGAGATDPDLRAPHSRWRLIGTECMNPTRTCALRTRLRDVNTCGEGPSDRAVNNLVGGRANEDTAGQCTGHGFLSRVETTGFVPALGGRFKVKCCLCLEAVVS